MGLCGDYNDNAEDDFKTPSGGISEAFVNLFGDSWKKDTFCPEPKDVLNACEQHPERKMWSLRRCNILKSSVFSPCHSEVEVESYLRNCIFDACSCDSGGDCECLCTSLAAYAHECNVKGVPVKWRTQELCPLQCNEEFSTYSPCISTCPRETCDNLMTVKDGSRLCVEDTCVEGCRFKPCLEGQVYWNATYTDCISKSTCKTPFCAEINGVIYHEGERVKGDDCQNCFCSRGKVTCKGEPCESRCVEGWSKWVNKDKAVHRTKRDVEPLPELMDLVNSDGFGMCEKENMVDIRCRSVKGHLSPKESGLDVECTLERGLYCQSFTDISCTDYEISVLCHCFKPTKLPDYLTTSTQECDPEHPNSPHPTNCQLFYQCVPRTSGYELVEKACVLGTLYDTNLQVCNFPTEILQTRPECAIRQTTPKWNQQNSGPSYMSTQTTLINSTVRTEKCKDGEVWSECAIECTKACHYYRHSSTQGHCNEGVNCIAGCVANRPTCPPHKYWRDSVTCVNVNECPCESHDGKLVAPGVVRKESDCETCQCINNYYTCDRASCDNATKIGDHPLGRESTFIPEQPSATPSTYWTSSVDEYLYLPQSTLTPPADCDNASYVPLIQSLHKKVIIHASSSRNPTLRPENLFVRMPETSPPDVRSWEPKVSYKDQWVAITFDKPEPVYGIILQGAVIEDKFVTSYKVLFSEDGQTFSYLLDRKKRPRVFRGPIDRTQSVEQKFDQPVEAKIIRIEPLTWHNGIAVRADVLGCQDNATSIYNSSIMQTTVSDHAVKPICDQPMGLDNKLMSIKQISVSSSPQLIQHLPLSAEGVWRSELDNPHQYVQFDFLEPRNLTGIMTKGGDGTWTTAYKIFYGNDKRHWNPVIDKHGNEKEFLGNFDAQSVKTNFFEKPLHARYMKIQPIKWHKHITLKVEPLGCFLAYTSTLPEKPESTTPFFELKCNVCDGIDQMLNSETCTCEDPYWWNGESCVPKQECPCIIGHLSYAVGSIYETEDCQECVCAMGGTSSCVQKKCKPCKPGERSIMVEQCNCLCKPCPIKTRYCPTSNICINETAWCNGVQDCPDDEEINCEKIVTVPIHESEVTPKPEVRLCEKPSCPADYKIVYKSNYIVKGYSKNNVKSAIKSFTKGGRKPPFHGSSKYTDHQLPKEDVQCLEFTCVPMKFPPILPGHQRPEKCPEASCPPQYDIVYEKMSMYKLHKCPKYACKPVISKMAYCNITGRTFNTFDDLEYKFDICNHILTRDRYNNKWYITLKKQCDSSGQMCTQVLMVTQDGHEIVLYPDLHVDVDKYSFTAKQFNQLGNRFRTFRLSRTGNSIVLLSHHGFVVIWNSAASVKIGVTSHLADNIDGLCGYYDGNIANDRQTPDGKQVRSTVQFGDSWAMEGSVCNSQVCPLEIQKQAWKICNSVKSPELSKACSTVVDINKFVSRCVEDSCTCLHGNNSYEDCRCRLLTSFVSECEAAVSGADLSDWRRIHDCPASCPPPFVHRDCFRNKCEITCDNLHELEPCPTMEGVCFPGCFCPDGLVRQDDKCVPPVQCRDCVCDGLGNSKFIDFNRKDFSFSGNCTYVLSRSVANNAKGQNGTHVYQILISNRDCIINTCTEAITLLYKKHVVEIKQIEESKELRVFVDDYHVAKFPYNHTWITLDHTTAGDVLLLLPAIQLELVAFRQNFAFNLKLPSHIFDDATEGLCGSCNTEETGFKKHDNEITNDAEEFSKSWLADDLLTEIGLSNQACSSKPRAQCIPPPANLDICRKLLDLVEFQQCHNIIDPKPYLDCCHDALCNSGNYCDSLEMYARKCSEVGLCAAWRTNEICPYECPAGKFLTSLLPFYRIFITF